MQKLNIEFLEEACKRALYYEYRNSIRGSDVVSISANMWYEKGRLMGYMTAFNLEYEDKDETVTIRNGKGKIVSIIDKKSVLDDVKRMAICM